MEVYNFDEIIPRRNTASVKWDLFEEDTLPLWVADMDFKTAPAVLEALRKRLEHGVFGYELVPQSYYDAVSNWFDRRHGWRVSRGSISFRRRVSLRRIRPASRRFPGPGTM